ncbi:PE domain-containing protein [Actinomadura flavalba]|uniref:PE domain-containing protein n=1 Tax=Actinomadura flavalba TaxID=1120938 RepID=UPI0003804F3A|nr:PE domain-containing protein [Actinomadura flavalba]
MTHGFEVSVEGVRSAGNEMRAVADRLAAAVRTFSAEVQGYGEPWGGDDVGMIVGAAHGAIFQAAMECFEAGAEEMGAAAQAVTEIAANYERMEETNTLYVNRIGEIL